MPQPSNIVYSDFDLSFVAHPETGNLQKKINADAVKQSVKILVLTQWHERFQHPELGSNVKFYMFENFDGITAHHIRLEIERVINNFEPRADLQSVKVSPNFDRHAFNVTIVFYIKNLQQPVEIDLFLDRIR